MNVYSIWSGICVGCLFWEVCSHTLRAHAYAYSSKLQQLLQSNIASCICIDISKQIAFLPALRYVHAVHMKTTEELVINTTPTTSGCAAEYEGTELHYIQQYNYLRPCEVDLDNRPIGSSTVRR